MGNSRKPHGAEQRVTHTNQLTPAKGHTAVLVAADGDTMKLSWDGDKWISDLVGDYRAHYAYVSQGYLTQSYQGNDASMTQYFSGNDPTISISDLIAWDDEYFSGRSIPDNLLSVPPIELKKWIKAGLSLAGRFQASLEETNSTADTPHVGPGMYSTSYEEFFNGTYYSRYSFYFSSQYIEGRRGTTMSFPALAANGSYNMLEPSDWMTIPIADRRVRAIRINSDSDINQTVFTNVEAYGFEDDQTILLAVHTVKDAGTTPSTPTIINSSLTWVQVDNIAYDVTGSERGRLTVFRTQVPSAGVLDLLDIDFGGINHELIMYTVVALVGEDRSGTNGSAAIVQVDNDLAGASSDLSVTLSAFASGFNSTMAFAGALDTGDYPTVVAADGTNWHDFFSRTTNDGSMYGALFAYHLFGTDTTPTIDVTASQSSGMIVFELAADLVNPQPDCGDWAFPGLVCYKEDPASVYTVYPSMAQFRFQTI